MPVSAAFAHRSSCCILLALCTLLLPENRLLADHQMEKEFQKTAVNVLQELHSAGFKTTGVLKFSVRIGRGAEFGTVGNLNMRLAEKLEVALAMANPATRAQLDKQVVVARAASDTASGIQGATHVTEEGRRLLFSKRYPLAWEYQGQTDAILDSFIVGLATVHSDLSRIDIGLLMFSKDDLEVRELASMSVSTDLDDLVDSGESFTTRGLFDSGALNQWSKQPSATDSDEDGIENLVKHQAFKIREETLVNANSQESRLHPLAPHSRSPVEFKIFYDNQLQPIEFRGGAAFIKEPAEGQKVSLVVRRLGVDKTRYGVLVRVNGENTLYHDRKPDATTPLWILEPNASGMAITGFQNHDNLKTDFKVLSANESEKRQIDYGRDVGMISLVIFEERQLQDAKQSDDDADLMLQSHTKLPEKTAKSRGSLGTDMFNELLGQHATRGLITGDGDQTSSVIEVVQFKRDTTPVMATSVRYYKPK